MRPRPLLPPGPDDGPLRQGRRLHRDPLGYLRELQDRYGDVFTLRLPTARPTVVVADPNHVATLAEGDPELTHAGQARRRILPQASPASAFGGDGAQHAAARARLEPALDPRRIDAQRPRMEAIVDGHVAGWPHGRPFRLLPRLRLIADEIAAKVLLGIRDEQRARELARAIGHMLWTPGNPPLSPPGEGDGLMGVAGAAFARRRMVPVKRLLAAELRERRLTGDTRGDDALACLLRARLTDDEAIDEILAVLMAAQEPMAAALTWMLERAARHPDVMPVLRDTDGTAREAVVKEALRLRPPALAMLRGLVRPLDVGGHLLPGGVTTMVPIVLLHHDPRVFADPDTFRPARWLAPETPDRFHVPFGSGVRRCLGEPLAHAEIGAVLPAILRRVTLRPVWPREEKIVLRATILVPHRSAPMIAAPAEG